MTKAYPNARLIHLPVHASWLNQIEIYFSIMQRKALTPNDFATLPELAGHLMDFGQQDRTIARPFEWTFTRSKLDAVIEKISRAMGIAGSGPAQTIALEECDRRAAGAVRRRRTRLFWAIGAARNPAVGAVRRHLGTRIDARRGLLLDQGASTNAASTQCAFVARSRDATFPVETLA